MDHHGYEVSEGLAGARTGLHQQVGLIIQRFRHASSHLDLSGARSGAKTIHSRSENAQGAPAGAVGVAGVAGVVGVIARGSSGSAVLTPCAAGARPCRSESPAHRGR